MGNKQNETHIIRYHNDLADIPLIGMTAAQANIFMAACFMYQHDLAERFASMEDLKNAYQEDIPYLECNMPKFLKLCNYTKGGPKKFVEDARLTYKSLVKFSVAVGEDEEEEIAYPFFHEFILNKKEKTFSLQIHKRAAYMLFGLERNYTQHDLDEFIRIKSVYAKRCYRELKRWRTVGKWKVGIGEFRSRIGVPEKFRECHMNQKVLSVITEQLSPIFKDLKIEKEYGGGRGGPVTGLVFTFRPEEKHPGVRKTNLLCPQCGKPLVEKTINGNNCWCHEDGWKEGAECSAIFNAVSDIQDNASESEAFPDEINERLRAVIKGV